MTHFGRYMWHGTFSLSIFHFNGIIAESNTHHCRVAAGLTSTPKNTLRLAAGTVDAQNRG